MPDINMMSEPNPRPDNHEAAMARADLYKLANYSFKLFKMIQDGQELEGWVQAKITKAADYIASVYHFMEYEMKFNEYGEQLQNADMYTESVRREFKRKLTEARVKLEKLKEKNIKDIEESDERGGDDDTPGKFNVRTTGTGTRYTRKSKTFSDEKHTEEPVKKSSKAALTGAERQAQKSKDKEQANASKDWQKRFGKDSVRKVEIDKKVKEGSLRGGIWTADAPKGGAPNVLPPSPDEGPTKGAKPPIAAPMKKPAPKTLDLDAARRDSRYGIDPKFTKAVKDAEAFAAAFSSSPIREALKGGQKKLDVDKDGKLEKSDFAKLRAGKVSEELKGEAEWKMNSHADRDKAKKAHADFVEKYGKDNVKWGSKNKFGVPTIMVRTSNKDVKEELKGGQKKLDVDKDGKLEKSDFAKLRASNVRK